MHGIDVQGRPSLRELEVLRSVIATRTTTRAARELGMSQPAVSRAISALELRLRTRLFARERGRLVPTTEALALNARSGMIFELVDDLLGYGQPAGGEATIRIAAVPTLAHGLLGPLLAAFVASQPDIRVHVEIGRSEDCLASVADGSADLGLVDQASASDGVRLETFRRASAHVVLPAGHRLATRARLAATDLAGEPLIALTRRFSMRTRIDAAFASAQVEPRIVAEGATSAFLVEMVRNGAGLTIVNPFPHELRPDPALVFRPFHPDIIFETKLALSASTPRSPAVQALADFIHRQQPAGTLSTPIR